MLKEKVFNLDETISSKEKSELVEFLYDHLDEYGDTKENIAKAIEYAMHPDQMAGGFVIETRESDQIVGAVVMNRTGMAGYIPENILVYIAVHRDHRGKGIGKILMDKAMKMAKGDIALHVEEDNPANFLYKKVGFVNPYLEMRFYKNGKPSKK